MRVSTFSKYSNIGYLSRLVDFAISDCFYANIFRNFPECHENAKLHKSCLLQSDGVCIRFQSVCVSVSVKVQAGKWRARADHKRCSAQNSHRRLGGRFQTYTVGL